MNLDNIYQLALYLANKDEEGGVVRVEDFNLIINAVNLELFEHEWEKLIALLQMTGRSIETTLYNSSPLAYLSTVEEYSGISGLLDKPTDFGKFVSLIYTAPTIQAIELVNEHQLIRLRTGVSDKQIELNPVCVIRADGIYIYPHRVVERDREAELVYIKIPTTPYYDYCILSTDESVYMPPGYTIRPATHGGSPNNLYNGTTLVYSDVQHLTATSFPYTSQSVELDWGTDSHMAFVIRTIEKLGIPLGQADLEQYSQTEQQKGE